eukprot:255460-Heterocapsa_arctica.AAC.1
MNARHGALTESRFHVGRISAGQHEFHRRLKIDVTYMFSRPGAQVQHLPMDFQALFAATRSGYDGEAVAMPCLLTVAEVEPGLPPLG